MQSKQLSNEQLYNPILQSGDFLPDIRTVQDSTPFIWKDGDMRKYHVAFEGDWMKVNITKDDDLEVRNLICDGLYANNFYAKSIRATNGDLILSDTGIVDKNEAVGSIFRVKNVDNSNLNPFQVGDLLYSTRFSVDDSLTYKQYRLEVTAINGLNVTYDYSAETGTNIPANTGIVTVDDTIVRLGNKTLGTYPERGNVIIMALTDKRDMGGGIKNFAPYMKMLTAVDSFNDYFNGLPSAMLGNLGSVVDTAFPTGSFLTPNSGTVGLYTSSAFLKGKFYMAQEDLLGDIVIGLTYRSATDPNTGAPRVIKEGDLWIDTSASNRFKTQVWVGNPSDHVSPGAWQAYLPGIWDAPSGAGLLITANYMGYYTGGAFKTYLRDNGSFYFAGYDANHYITWDGTSAELTIAGKVMVTNEQNFVKNPVTYVQAADPKLSVTVYEGTLWYDSDETPTPQWRKWIGANSAYATPGSWEVQVWGTYINSTGIYTGTVTAGQVNTGVLAIGQIPVSSINTSAVNNDAGFITSATVGAKSFYSSTAPTVIGDGLKVGDFWFDTTAGTYRMKRCATITPGVTWDSVGVYMDSSGVYAGNITAGQITAGTFTGLTFQTDTGAVGHYQRVEISASTNNIIFWDSTNASVGAMAAATGQLQISGSNLLLTGSVTSDITLQTFTAAGLYGDINLTSSRNIEATGSGSFTWNSAAIATESWVTSQGYSTTSMVYPGAGIAVSTGTAWGTSITDNSSNWNTAYGWGNHASAGYLTSSTEGWRTTDVTALGNGLEMSANTLQAKVYTATGISLSASGIGINAGTGLANSSNALVVNYDGVSIKINGFGQLEVDGYAKTNWNTAYSWGDHGVVGYIVNPTDANGRLKNDGFGAISWSAITNTEIEDALGYTPAYGSYGSTGAGTTANGTVALDINGTTYYLLYKTTP